jgi:PAS domain S-box-containing protein
MDRIAFANPAAFRLFGATNSVDLEGHGLLEFVHPDFRPDVRRLMTAIAAGETSSTMEARIVRVDGAVRDVETVALNFEDDDGACVELLVRDITERKRDEDEARQSERQLRGLAENMAQLAWTARPDGYIDWYNRRWYEYTGTTPEEMAGWGWQSVHDPAALPEVLDRWQASIATGEPFDMVFPLRGGDGFFRPFLTRVNPVRDAEGRVAAWFGTNTDLSRDTGFAPITVSRPSPRGSGAAESSLRSRDIAA